MKVAIMQPYFFPYIGYWQLIRAVDTHVIYDDVTYMKGSWINRNNFLINGKKRLYTISLKNSSSFRLINEIEVLDDFAKFIKMLKMSYAKSPFFKDTMNIVDIALSYDKSNLAVFLGHCISVVCNYLNIETKLLYSSSLPKDNALKGQAKVLNICGLLDASVYINAIGGTDLYDKEAFRAKNIELFFLKTSFSPYTQMKNEFIPGMSIIDVMMFNPPERIKDMLKEYALE